MTPRSLQRLGIRFLNASGKHDIHHLAYHMSSSSSSISYPLFVDGGSGGGVVLSSPIGFRLSGPPVGGDFVGVSIEGDGESSN